MSYAVHQAKTYRDVTYFTSVGAENKYCNFRTYETYIQRVVAQSGLLLKSILSQSIYYVDL